MGYNRSGDRRKQRLKRHKREMERLVTKMLASETPPGQVKAETVKNEAK